MNKIEFDREDIWNPRTPSYPTASYFFCTLVQKSESVETKRQYLSLGDAIDFETDEIFIVYGIEAPTRLNTDILCDLYTFKTDRGYTNHEIHKISLTNESANKLRVFNIGNERFRLRFIEWLGLEFTLSDNL